MIKPLDTDIVVGGGGMAGLMIAIALGRQGFRVVLLEPCVYNQQRLGGEILQPMGVHALAQLGLLDAAYTSNTTTLAGFHIWDDEAGDVQINYSSPQFGIAIEHENLRRLLLNAATRIPNINIVIGRVTGYAEQHDCIEVQGTDKAENVTYRATLLIGADGARSRIRTMAGIACRHGATSKLNILTFPDELLPDTQTGHLFVGHGAIGFCYSLGQGKARLLVDHRQEISRSVREVAALLPENDTCGFKRGLSELPDDQPIHHYVTSLAVVSKPYRGRVALIGDAAGTCHPITASGMTSAILDAVELAQTLSEHWENTPHALATYASRCRWRHASRVVLANAMYEIYTGTAPECLPLRRAMIFDFGHQGSSSASSLLSMTRDHPAMIVHTMTRTLLHGLMDLCVHPAPPTAYTRRSSRLRTGISTSSRMLRYGTALFNTPWRFSMLNGHDSVSGSPAKAEHRRPPDETVRT